MNDRVDDGRQALGSLAIRRARAKRLIMPLAIFVVMPTLLAVVHYGLMATPQFESVAVFTVDYAPAHDKQGKNTAAEQGLDVVRAYIHSRAMLDGLAKDHGLMDHYGSDSVDWWSRLSSGAGSGETFDYYREHVTVTAGTKSTLTLSVHAFSPKVAHTVADAILKRSSKQLDDQSDQTRSELMSNAEQQVDIARKRLAAAAGAAPSDVELEVARQRLAAALRMLEAADDQAARRDRRLTVISAPSTPTEASRPRKLWNIMTVFVTALTLAGIFLLMGDFVREHAKF